MAANAGERVMISERIAPGEAPTPTMTPAG